VSENNSNKLQNVIGDDLFPNVQHVSDVKQVLEFMKPVAQPLREEQIRSLIFLNQLGENKRLHPKNPYTGIINKILDDYKTAIAETKVYLDTIEELIPKPPKPVVMMPNGKMERVK